MDIYNFLKKVSDSGVRGFGLKVLVYLLSSNLYDRENNTIRITQRQIARDLDIEQCMANKSIAELKDKNIISVEKISGKNTYTFIA